MTGSATESGNESEPHDHPLGRIHAKLGDALHALFCAQDLAADLGGRELEAEIERLADRLDELYEETGKDGDRETADRWPDRACRVEADPTDEPSWGEEEVRETDPVLALEREADRAFLESVRAAKAMTRVPAASLEGEPAPGRGTAEGRGLRPGTPGR